MKDEKILSSIQEKIALANFKKEHKRNKKNKKIFLITASALTIIVAGIFAIDAISENKDLDYI